MVLLSDLLCCLLSSFLQSHGKNFPPMGTDDGYCVSHLLVFSFLMPSAVSGLYQGRKGMFPCLKYRKQNETMRMTFVSKTFCQHNSLSWEASDKLNLRSI